MSFPLSLLKDTNSEAVMFLVYGGPGLNKTLAIRELPGRILMYDWDGGSGPLMPWTNRRRRSSDSQWTDYTQAEREHAFSLLIDEFKLPELDGPSGTKIDGPNKYNPPAPLIDVIVYEPLRAESYDEFVIDVGNFQSANYESAVVDSMQEFSQGTQSFAKRLKGISTLEPMELSIWGGAQERAAIAIRRIKALKKSGVFTYITGGEEVDKEYANDPRSAPKGSTPDQPYAIKGSIQVPGKLVGVLGHASDIMLHGRVMNGKVVWVASKESLSGGSGASWETKDRFGRLGAYNPPSFKKILRQLYGTEVVRELYKRPDAAKA